MVVSVTWATSPSGSAASLIDHGTATNGTYGSSQQIYLRHDGLNSISNCGFYFQLKTGSYTGDFSAAADFDEIKGWGDSNSATGHGGIQVNMDPSNTTGWDVGNWDLDNSNKQTTVAFTMHSLIGDQSTNSVTLKEHMDGTGAGGGSMTSDGEIPTGVEVSFLIRFQIPTDEDTTGIRQIDQVLRYTFTS